VLLAHYWPLYERFPNAMPLKYLGNIGVEIFFVLSGFLIGGILLRQAAELAGKSDTFGLASCPIFWGRRWFRTLPNYALFYVLFLLYCEPWLTGHWKPWILSAFFSQNLFRDLSEGTFGIAWSLCVEEWLYLLLPLAMVMFTATTRIPKKAALFSALALILIPTVLRCTTAGKDWDLGVRHVVIYRLDAIAYGVLLAYFARYQHPLFNRIAGGTWATCGLLVMIGIWFHWYAFGHTWVANGQSDFGVHWFAMNVASFSIMSLAIVPIVAWASRVTVLPPGVRQFAYRTSIYSYSMYLGHELVYYFAHPRLDAAMTYFCGQFRGLTFVVGALDLAAIYLFSSIVYHLWEAPMTALRERVSFSKAISTVSVGGELNISSA
jgi:peptidoglycan/LPS O-acetylase OafA/YrhL